MLDQHIWVIVPAYNEEESVERVVRGLLEVTSNIVLVNDCSSDATASIIDRLPVHALHHKVNRGQGAALQTGTDYALLQGAHIIVHFDADGQMQVRDIPVIIKPIQQGDADIVFGSRFLAASNAVPFTKKLFILTPAKLLNWIFTGMLLSDAHCGFRALSSRAASRIRIIHDGMAHATEIVDQTRRHRLRYVEVPVDIVYHEYGQRLSSGFKILRDIIFGKLVRRS